ncbi:hypothetical protein SVIO_096750 [Streptomyces violaceusniger]|uniref:beta-glucosidase n=1 Tax=Streptomyces violaceusniger TaxID=68280 RepID=A0A4D4LCR3_STRVO|nr:hypothetical protein SVIO_096750 [Streptomyces violaceusniger]
MARMSIDEKLGQLQQLAWTGATGPGGGQTAAAEKAARGGRLGSVLNIYGARTTNTLQRMAVEESRLGIPLVFGLDVIHGMWTTFPIPLAQAAAFDPAVAERDAEVSAREARSNGVHWAFSPMMDVTHEPRWGGSPRATARTRIWRPGSRPPRPAPTRATTCAPGTTSRPAPST